MADRVTGGNSIFPRPVVTSVCDLGLSASAELLVAILGLDLELFGQPVPDDEDGSGSDTQSGSPFQHRPRLAHVGIGRIACASIVGLSLAAMPCGEPLPLAFTSRRAREGQRSIRTRRPPSIPRSPKRSLPRCFSELTPMGRRPRLQRREAPCGPPSLPSAGTPETSHAVSLKHHRASHRCTRILRLPRVSSKPGATRAAAGQGTRTGSPALVQTE